MTAITSTLQSVSLSLNVTRQAEVEMSIRAQLRPVIYAYQRTAKNVEANLWSARVEGAYRLEQAGKVGKEFANDLKTSMALLIPFAILWGGVLLALHVRTH